MEEKQLSSAILKFSAKMLKEINNDTSVVSSPLSVEIILAILALGDSGSAREELLNALEIPNENSIRTSFASLLQKLDNLKDITLVVANKLYLKQGLELDPQLEKDAIDVFKTDVEQMNFFEAAESAYSINQWAESKTHNKIKHVISVSDLDETTRMIVINAIYFKGTWKLPFPASNTHNAPFHVDENTTIMVPMMESRGENWNMGYNDQFQTLLLPYQNEQWNMIILLPKNINGIGDLLDKLAGGYDLVSEVKSLWCGKVKAMVPKFKIETEINLKNVLPKLGIKSIFNPGVDRMLKETQRLLVSQAVQKAFIEVNEQGTEAAAVTTKKLIKKKGPRYFTANRPFVYILSGTEWNTLFIGVYRGEPPQQWKIRHGMKTTAIIRL